MTENNSEYIKSLISNHGTLSVSSFMAEALFNKKFGYYQTKKIFGKDGDFVTSPEISQMFGEMIGVWATLIWQQLDEPTDFSLVEIGAGNGTLMHDLLRGTKHLSGFQDAANIYLIEKSSRLKKIQQNTLEDYKDRIFWLDDVSKLPQDKPLITFSNELLDALPIYQFKKENNKWYEIRVGINEHDSKNHDLCFVLEPVENSQFYQLLASNYKDATNGDIVEISPSAISIISELASVINECNGACLTIDYGYLDYEFKNTLQALKNHKFSNVLENIGEADITAHVDFKNLYKAVKRKDVDTCEITTQQYFLKNLGIELRAGMLLKNANPSQQKDIESALQRLTDPKQMGSLFKVMAFSSNNIEYPLGYIET